VIRLSTNARTAVKLARLAGITRICFGTAFIVAPHASARPWVGAGADSAGAQLLTRSMGIRDLLLGVGLLQALNQADHRTAARWLSYGAAAGVIDAGATLAAYPSLPQGGRAARSATPQPRQRTGQLTRGRATGAKCSRLLRMETATRATNGA
jgi:hypothetical protein